MAALVITIAELLKKPYLLFTHPPTEKSSLKTAVKTYSTRCQSAEAVGMEMVSKVKERIPCCQYPYACRIGFLFICPV